MVKQTIPALRITLEKSTALTLFIFVTHTSAMAVVFLVPLNIWMQLSIALAVMVSLIQAFRNHVWRLNNAAIRSVEWDSDGEWLLFTVSGDELSAQLKGSSYVQPWLVVLNFSIGRFGRHSLILLPDAVAPELLRRLRVRLRLLGNMNSA